VTGDARVPISGLTIDSRRVRPGDLFVALAGEKTDGLRFVARRARARRRAVLSDRPRPKASRAPGSRRPTPARRSALVAREIHGRPDEKLPVIGVTGTNGKTTLTYLLEAIVSAAGGSSGVMGTISYRIGGEASTPTARRPRRTPSTTTSSG
jgi:UDP-N-acetylmuramoyl-L-alanyl-D-glutamate--2,6-diaminopimelate ligase